MRIARVAVISVQFGRESSVELAAIYWTFFPDCHQAEWSFDQDLAHCDIAATISRLNRTEIATGLHLDLGSKSCIQKCMFKRAFE